MPLPRAAIAHRARTGRRSAATRLICRDLWRRVGLDFDPDWREIASRLGLVVSSAQVGAARDASIAVSEVLAETGVPDRPEGIVRPEAFAGRAGDGRPLDSLLYGAVVKAKVTAAGGESTLDEQLQAGEDWLDMAVRTAVADADRQASQAAIAARPDVAGFVRVVNLPTCSRCIVLAGSWYRYNAAFARHFSCDCTQSPAMRDEAREMVTDPAQAIRDGQVRGLSKADTRAILDGSDPGRVINSRRGMYEADGVKLTRTVPGSKRRDALKSPRLRPEAIYRQNVSREQHIALLKANGYLL